MTKKSEKGHERKMEQDPEVISKKGRQKNSEPDKEMATTKKKQARQGDLTRKARRQRKAGTDIR